MMSCFLDFPDANQNGNLNVSKKKKHASYGHSAILDLPGALEKSQNIFTEQYRAQNTSGKLLTTANLGLLFNLCYQKKLIIAKYAHMVKM